MRPGDDRPDGRPVPTDDILAALRQRLVRRSAPAADASSRQGFGVQVAAFTAVAFTFGVTFGVTGVTTGLSIVKTMALSTMFAGAAQFTALAIVATDGAAVTAFIAAMFLNARYGLLSLSVAQKLRMGLVRRLFAALLMGDPGVALALAEPDDERRDRTYWVTALWTGLGWMLGTLVGALGGAFIGDPDVLGLDAALPVLMLAILGQYFRDRLNTIAAVSGACIGVAFIAFAPTGIPVLAGALGALVPLLILHRGRTGEARRRTARGGG